MPLSDSSHTLVSDMNKPEREGRGECMSKAWRQGSKAKYQTYLWDVPQKSVACQSSDVLPYGAFVSAAG